MRLLRNDPVYAALKEATSNEGIARRVVAIATGFSFLMSGFLIGLLAGCAMVRGLFEGREAAWTLINIVEGKVGVGEFAWGMLLGIVGAHIAAQVWRLVLLRLKLASPDVRPHTVIGEVLEAL